MLKSRTDMFHGVISPRLRANILLNALAVKLNCRKRIESVLKYILMSIVMINIIYANIKLLFRAVWRDLSICSKVFIKKIVRVCT